jgi:hypothetical protein
VIKLDENGSVMISRGFRVLGERLMRGVFLKRVTFEEDSVLEETTEHAFEWNETLESISFPSSIIKISNFIDCRVLGEVLFGSISRLEKIDGSMKCTSLSRKEIPESVTVITTKAFCECTSLIDVRFAADSHLRSIFGFWKCPSLCQIAKR